jgi:hypothetical protein
MNRASEPRLVTLNRAAGRAIRFLNRKSGADLKGSRWEKVHEARLRRWRSP